MIKFVVNRNNCVLLFACFLCIETGSGCGNTARLQIILLCIFYHRQNCPAEVHHLPVESVPDIAFTTVTLNLDADVFVMTGFGGGRGGHEVSRLWRPTAETGWLRLDAVYIIICRMEICWATKGPRWGPKVQYTYITSTQWAHEIIRRKTLTVKLTKNIHFVLAVNARHQCDY